MGERLCRLLSLLSGVENRQITNKRHLKSSDAEQHQLLILIDNAGLPPQRIIPPRKALSFFCCVTLLFFFLDIDDLRHIVGKPRASSMTVLKCPLRRLPISFFYKNAVLCGQFGGGIANVKLVEQLEQEQSANPRFSCVAVWQLHWSADKSP